MTSPRRTLFRGLLIALLGAAGLALYLWPALKAPVVLWSDSHIDLEWARQGVGIVSPAPPPLSPHPAKPGWIAFLRAAAAGAAPEAAPRRVVVLQTVLLWLSIAGTSLYLARKTSFGRGVALYVVLISFLRLPGVATSVMSEALTAALFLPIAAALLDPPERLGPAVALGFGTALLFLVRPNAGAVAGALALLAFASTRRRRALVGFAVAGVVLVAPVWIRTSPPDRDALRGLAPAFVWAKAEYGWTNAAELFAPDSSEAGRQLVWRLFHGLLGGEHYDASWSSAWMRLEEWSRILSPFLVLGAVALLLAPSRARAFLPRVLGLALAALLIGQSYLLGALPRFALPFLPGLFLFAAAAWPPVRAVAVVLYAGLLAAARWQRHVLDREWGRIEAAGIRISQELPRGALPDAAKATLRIRVGPVLLPSSAGLLVLDPAGELLYDSRKDPDRRRPYIEIPLTPELLAENREKPVTLTLVSHGFYAGTQYLLFPVIPRPWIRPAVREGSETLSPSTGLVSGGLDWWVRSP